jgi:hypothetical protein
MSSTQTADEMFNSLNGFDELAIAKHFNAPLEQLVPTEDKVTGKKSGSPFLFQRALAFIDLRRHDVADRDAFKQAMELSIEDANGYFADPVPEADPDDPDTEAGKGSEPSD